MTDRIDATKNDGKAARELFRSVGPAICEAMEYGGCEETAIFAVAQAFTRHRIASTAAIEAERDALAERIEALELDVAAQEALHNSAYLAGMKAGYQFGDSGDSAGFAAAIDSTEHVAVLRRIRAARKALGEVG